MRNREFPYYEKHSVPQFHTRQDRSQGAPSFVNSASSRIPGWASADAYNRAVTAKGGFLKFQGRRSLLASEVTRNSAAPRPHPTCISRIPRTVVCSKTSSSVADIVRTRTDTTGSPNSPRPSAGHVLLLSLVRAVGGVRG